MTVLSFIGGNLCFANALQNKEILLQDDIYY